MTCPWSFAEFFAVKKWKDKTTRLVGSVPTQGMLAYVNYVYVVVFREFIGVCPQCFVMSAVHTATAHAGPDSFAAGAGDMANVWSWWFGHLHNISAFSLCSFRHGIEQGNYSAVDANRLQDTTSTYISLKNRQVKAEVAVALPGPRPVLLRCGITCTGGGREMCGWCHWICTSTCPSGGQQWFFKLT